MLAKALPFIAHATWIPEPDSGQFVQGGDFYLWVETTKPSAAPHPFHLHGAALLSWLEDALGISARQARAEITSRFFWLPTHAQHPLRSWQAGAYLQDEIPANLQLACWPIECYRLRMPHSVDARLKISINASIVLLNALHFYALSYPEQLQLGPDALFWYRYTQSLKQIILKDHYIPALHYRAPAAKKTGKARSTRSKNSAADGINSKAEIYPSWIFMSQAYQTALEDFAKAMPLVCCLGQSQSSTTPMAYEATTLLRHCSEQLLNELIWYTPKPLTFNKQLEGSLLEHCCAPAKPYQPLPADYGQKIYRRWLSWYARISAAHQPRAFVLYFKLTEPQTADEPWRLEFWVSPQDDPSLQIALQDYWRCSPAKKRSLLARLGKDFEGALLLQLGYAARMYPLLWSGLHTNQPAALELDLSQAHEFLRQNAWVLEDAGFKVAIPAWWSAAGQRRAKLRLRGRLSSAAGTAKAEKASSLSLQALVTYDYRLAIGDAEVSADEWRTLIEAKQSLVLFRGQWVELDIHKMTEMLRFWEKQSTRKSPLDLLAWMQEEAKQNDDFAIEREESLEQLLAQIKDSNRLAPIGPLAGLHGTLRDYQQRGVSWLAFLERLGLNGCLADDMGLGKTLQVIARLLHERSEITPQTPTLLIAPTSVLGNWEYEVKRFAPQLKVLIHHGQQRTKASDDWQNSLQDVDLLITSYSLIRRDSTLFKSITWHRIVLDEAQNIKNPQAQQSKAIMSLNARHRLALTGTPIENRLLDLWSIFHFLNPGYLGKQATFRKQFETAIQRDKDMAQAKVLKQLVEPLILRRLKTDQNIIKDLPDKIEQTLHCNLTKEQASLYQVVVREVEEALQDSEGMQRKGLMLSALMRLKQICNHPRQYLQDDSEFSAQRSHKLARLLEMSEEVLSVGESLLIFTQFKEIGHALEAKLRHEYRYETYFLHGGTARPRREQMIRQFQDPASPPAVFILSLKAGGVGITLTRANHVFHFDRWWNPAVENQATDRAFRIGQTRNVFVHKFLTIGTLEERIDAMIKEKQQLAESMVSADESWLTELDNDTFRQLIALNRDSILD